jgi:hypothetical protein
MFKRLIGSALGLTLLVSGVAQAQTSKSPAPAATKNEKAVTQPKTIYDYQGELGLTGAQVDKIRRTLGGFAQETQAKRRAYAEADKEYANLVNSRASLEAIKSQLQASMQLQFELRWLDVVTARKIEAIMTPAQLAKWHELQESARKTKK